eukprot:6187304-Pleurochrysis_carterae.AAC.4
MCAHRCCEAIAQIAEPPDEDTCMNATLSLVPTVCADMKNRVRCTPAGALSYFSAGRVFNAGPIWLPMRY